MNPHQVEVGTGASENYVIMNPHQVEVGTGASENYDIATGSFLQWVSNKNKFARIAINHPDVLPTASQCYLGDNLS